MKTEECGLCTREWDCHTHTKKEHELGEKRLKYSAKSGMKFYAKAFTVQ